MRTKPLVSIITVVRNDVNHIKRTIESVLEQNYENVEYIIIDGDSTDGTLEIILEYKDRVDVIISEPDKGIYDAMNKGIIHATGTWINFMNSGDSFYNDHVIHDIFDTYFDKGESVIYGKTNVVNELTGTSAIIHFDDDPSMPSQHQSLFTRTYELKNHPFDTRYRIIADKVFYYDLYKRNSSYLSLELVISNYDDSGLSGTLKEKMYKENAIFYFRKINLSCIKSYLKYLLKKYNLR